jgi:hypothetical protein
MSTLTLRQIFSSRELFLASTKVIFALFETARAISFPIRGVRLAASQQLMPEAPMSTLFEAFKKYTTFLPIDETIVSSDSFIY